MNTLVVDLSANTSYQKLWEDTLDIISTSTDKLKANYLGLDPSKFESFPVVIIDNQIVCFSGLQMEDRWGLKIARCSTRMWIHPNYRHSGKFTSGSKFLNTSFCLPLQFAKAKLLNLDCLFISRESTPSAFGEYIKLVKRNTGQEFTILPDMINVCGITPVPDTCKQWVAVSLLNDQSASTWTSQMSQFICN